MAAHLATRPAQRVFSTLTLCCCLLMLLTPAAARLLKDAAEPVAAAAVSVTLDAATAPQLAPTAAPVDPTAVQAAAAQYPVDPAAAAAAAPVPAIPAPVLPTAAEVVAPVAPVDPAVSVVPVEPEVTATAAPVDPAAVAAAAATVAPVDPAAETAAPVDSAAAAAAATAAIVAPVDPAALAATAAPVDPAAAAATAAPVDAAVVAVPATAAEVAAVEPAAAAAAISALPAPVDPAADPAAAFTAQGLGTLLPSSQPGVISAVGQPMPYEPAAAAADDAAAAAVPAVAEAAEADAAATATETTGLITTAAMSSTYQGCFDAHNNYRARHQNTNGLVWNDTLAASAATYAAKCIWAHDSTNTVQGENLYATSASALPQQYLLDAIKAFYDEIALYNYSAPGFSSATGHFTALVWKATTSVGCAYTICNNGLTNFTPGRFFLVCRYFSRGNVNTALQFKTNVQPLKNASSPSPSPKPSPSPSPKPSPSPSPKPSPSPSPAPSTATVQSKVFSPSTTAIKTSSSSPPCVYSPNQQYSMCIDKYGVVQVKKTGQTSPVWKSVTTGWSSFNAPYSLRFQSNGRLSVFNKNSATTAIWNANAASLGSGSGYKLHVRDDGKLKIVDGKGTQTWST